MLNTVNLSVKNAIKSAKEYLMNRCFNCYFMDTEKCDKCFCTTGK